MESLTANIKEAFLAQSGWEILAVITGVLYLVLATREILACWYFGAISTLIYLILLADVKLYAEAALQVYYLAMAAYGWYSWKYGSGKADAELPIITGSFRFHLTVAGGIVAGTLLTGYALNALTDARLPYIDAFTTIGAVVTTWMVTKKYLENWIYWFFVDSVAIYMYWEKELYLTALLFLVYVVMVIVGFFNWRRHLATQVS